jgi:hypothetical protein
MRKLLTLPKLLAVFTVAAATLLPVGAASAGVVNNRCYRVDNNRALWCQGQSDGYPYQRGLWIGARHTSISASQHRVDHFWWNGRQWMYFHTGYHPIVATPSTSTGWLQTQIWWNCYNNYSASLWTRPVGTAIANTCGMIPGLR